MVSSTFDVHFPPIPCVPSPSHARWPPPERCRPHPAAARPPGSEGRCSPLKCLWILNDMYCWEVKLPTIWTNGKAEVIRVSKEKSRRKKIREEKESEERRCRCAKGRKVAVHCVFPVICGSGGSKSRLAKAAGAKASGQMRDEKLHAVVVRSTFRSQKWKKTPWSGHFWNLRCWKSARRCGAKHLSKSRCTKHTILIPLLEVEMLKKRTPLWLEVEMSKKCTPLWREAHFQVQSVKNWRDHFWTLRCLWRRKGLCTLSKVSKT